MSLTIHPLRNGRCVIAGHHAFHGGDPIERYEYALIFWLILGGKFPVLVDTGLDRVEEMNQGAAHVLAEPITQAEDDDAGRQLARFGLREEEIGMVFVTHLHFDHVDRLDRFTNARYVVSGRGLDRATSFPGWHGTWAPHKTLDLLTRTAKERTIAADDIEAAPGIRTLWVGGHSPCSQAVLVETEAGTVCLTGDTVSLLRNIETMTPVGVHADIEECVAGMKRIRDSADLILPSHDPGVFERFPGGAIP